MTHDRLGISTEVVESRESSWQHRFQMIVQLVAHSDIDSLQSHLLPFSPVPIDAEMSSARLLLRDLTLMRAVLELQLKDAGGRNRRGSKGERIRSIPSLLTIART